MSTDYKYFIREFADKEALRVFIEDEMNRPDSLDELVSVITDPTGLLVGVGRSRRQARAQDPRSERGMSSQREHERYQGGTNYPDPPPGGHRRPRPGGQRHEGHKMHQKGGGGGPRPMRPGG